jgi:hypothetical protein
LPTFRSAFSSAAVKVSATARLAGLTLVRPVKPREGRLRHVNFHTPSLERFSRAFPFILTLPTNLEKPNLAVPIPLVRRSCREEVCWFSLGGPFFRVKPPFRPERHQYWCQSPRGRGVVCQGRRKALTFQISKNTIANECGWWRGGVGVQPG